MCGFVFCPCTASGQESKGKIIMNNENGIFFQGQFMTAMPGLQDENFFHSVVCITEHTGEGALGLIINRKHPHISCSDVFRDIGVAWTHKAGKQPVYIGGPVHENRIFILHSAPFEWEGCVRFSGDTGISNTLDIVSAIAGGAGPERFMLMLGCCGWAGNQLELEIMNNLWLTSPVDMDILFGVDPEHRWRESIAKMGIDPAHLSVTSGNA